MAGFYGQNPSSTVVGTTDATESTISQNAINETDTSSGFYQGSPSQTTTNAYTADALSSANAAAISAAAAAASAANSASTVLTGAGSTTVTGTHPNFTITTPTNVSAFNNDENYLDPNSTVDAGNF